EAAAVGGEAEHELCAAADRFVVGVKQFIEAFERSFIVGVPEPVQLAQRGVGLDGAPAAVAMAVDYVPVFVVDQAGFVADPAGVAVLEEAGIGEDDGVGLIGAQGFDDFFEVVDVAFAAGSVEPEFDEVAVARCQLGELVVVVAVVGGGIVVAGIVTVPGREIDAELEAVLAGGAGHVADHVAFAVAPWGVLDAVGSLGGGPEAEAIVVLGDEDHVFGAGIANGFHP